MTALQGRAGWLKHAGRSLWQRANDKGVVLSILAILTAGVSLRVWHVVAGRSLWLDEAMIALNIINRAPHQLLEQLDYGQIAPMGWLLLQKFSQGLLDDFELSLRLFPLIFGVASTLIFAYLSVRYLSRFEALFCIFAASVLPSLIYYSGEVKPYISDVFFSCALLLVTLYLLEREKWRALELIILFVLGSAGILMSFPSAFVLAGVGAGLFYQCLLSRTRAQACFILLISCLWLFLFTLTHMTIYAAAQRDVVQAMQVYWARQFATFPPRSFEDLFWFYKSFLNISGSTIYFNFGLAAFFYLIGLVRIWTNDRARAVILAFPLLAALAASSFKLYPFSDRFLLFATPQVLICIAAGLELIWSSIKKPRVVIGSAVALLLAFPVAVTTYEFARSAHKPFDHENIEAALAILAREYHSGDVVYVYYRALAAFRLYRSEYGLGKAQIVEGRSPRQDWGSFLSDLERVRQFRRVWFLFAHVQKPTRVKADGIDDQRMIVFLASQYGRELQRDLFRGAALVLYRFDLEQNRQGSARE